MNKDLKTKYGSWAVITGGSAGIGLAFSNLLAGKGMNILMIARNPEKLASASEQVRKQHGVRVDTLSQDLLDPGAVDKIADYTGDLHVGLVVLNAGMELTGHFIKRNREDHARLMRLNTEVPTQMAHFFAERFVEKGTGGIIFVSSLFGYQGVPMFTTYSASKAYILTLGEGLSVELKPYGVDVTVLSPGPTNTTMLNNMDVNFGKLPVLIMSAEKTARVALKALGKKVSVVPGLLNKIYVNENRFMPRNTPIKLFGWLTQWGLKDDKQSEYLINSKPKSNHK